MDLSVSDLYIQDDVYSLNSGFYLVKASLKGTQLMKLALGKYMHESIDDQPALNKAVKEMKKEKQLIVQTLSRELYPCGLIYFERGRRMFIGDNEYCEGKICDAKPFIVHNNWIVSKAAKIYRFKEVGLWNYDFNGYYSNITQKYIAYENPRDFGIKTIHHEKMALNTALTMGKILNRIVILPKFHCHTCKNVACKQKHNLCAFNAHFNVRVFDHYFKGLYRENNFLNHYKVPKNIKESVSPNVYIDFDNHTDGIEKGNNTLLFKIGDNMKLDVGSFLSWLDARYTSKFNVLNFHSMYFDINFNSISWDKQLNDSLRKSKYRQSQ